MARFKRDTKKIYPFDRFIRGSAELTIQPLHDKLTTIRLNCRQSKILAAFVNQQSVEFTHNDSVAQLALGNETDITHHQAYKSRYLNAVREADDGELSLKLPDNAVEQIPNSNASTGTNPPHLSNAIHSPNTEDTSSQEYMPLTIRVDFELDNPRWGLVFVEPDKNIAPHRCHHLYTVNQPLPGGARSWLPCIDRISERCTWDMEFIVPSRMGSSPYMDTSFDDDKETVIVCSGEMVEQAMHPTDASKKIVRYNLAVPTAAPFIGFAIGPFDMVKFTPAQLQEEILTEADLDENQQQSLVAELNMMSNIYAFALPGHQDDLSTTCRFLMQAMHFYGQEYGSYPFSDFKLAFVEDAWNDVSGYASLAICSSHLLTPPDIIDQTFQTRKLLSLALARQWFGIHIIQKSWPDIWLMSGLANLIASLFIKRHLGNNEYRLRLKRDMDLCCQLDVNRAPLYNPALPLPLDPEDLDFIELKAPLVLYMLDKRMCKGGSTLGLSRVLPKILVSAMSGELPNNALSTHHFLRLCRKVSSYDTRAFAEQWIYRSGCPKFTFSFHFNRKKMVVEFYMRQENTSAHAVSGTEGAGIDYHKLVTPTFTGSLTARIHEADGTPYEHILNIHSSEQKFEVQFNTKYKRIRRNTKRFLAKQAAAAAAVAEENPDVEEPNDSAAATALGIIPSLGLGMPVFEDEELTKEWRIVEWGQDEQDTSGAASATFDWIRLDAEFEWLCILDFQQPDYMWAAELTKDRDVVAQYEAIVSLKRMPSFATATSLLRALLDPKCFYKIRMEAAYGLATCALPSLDWVGLLQLSKAFQKRYCYPPPFPLTDPDAPLTTAMPKPNQFSHMTDYFVQKAIVVALSQVHDEHGIVPLRIRQFLLDLLKYNDNTGNEFSDNYYVATLISALGDALVPANDHPDARKHDDIEGEQLLEAAKAEIERFRTLDYVVPSYHNVVTVSCLKTMTKLMMNGLMDLDASVFLPYTRYGNFVHVRCTAFDSLLVLFGLFDDALTQYFMTVIQSDPSVCISHYVARAMLAWLGIAMKQEMLPTKEHFEEFSEEEGRAVLNKQAEKSEAEALYKSIETLRALFADRKAFQKSVWDLLNGKIEDASPDHCIRKYLLQLCEYMYKPIDTGVKVTIRMPTWSQPATRDNSPEPTPTPPSAPILRISLPKPPVKVETPAIPKKPTIVRIKTTVEKTPVTIPTPPSPSSSAVSPEPTPAEPELPKPSIPVDDLKDCQKLYNKLRRHRAAILFLQPVDEVLDNAPNYYTVIKRPMDLGTIKKKLDTQQYESFHAFEDDVRLMLNNCFTYNAPGTYAYTEGQALETAFEKEVSRIRGKSEGQNMTIVEGSPASVLKEEPVAVSKEAPKERPVEISVETPIETPADTPVDTPAETSVVALPSPVHATASSQQTSAPQKIRLSLVVGQPNPKKSRIDMEKCAAVLAKLTASRHATEFLQPVDPIKQGVPHYADIIKHPMDLGTIKSKLEDGQYTHPNEFDQDVRLVLNNCYTFNPPNTYIHEQCKQLERVYNKAWHKRFGDYPPSSNQPTAPTTNNDSELQSENAPKPRKPKKSKKQHPDTDDDKTSSRPVAKRLKLAEGANLL